MSEKQDFAKYYSNVVNSWKLFSGELNRFENAFGKKFNRPIKRLKGNFLELASELWVASKLQKYDHDVKIEYRRGHADLYVGELGIEVKGCTRKDDQGIAWWGFNLGNASQLFERSYQVLVLVRADENSVPFDCFIIDKKELERYPTLQGR